MKKSVLIIVVVFGLILAWYFLRSSLTPSLALLSPQGGETWEVGSNQLIRWDSEKLPQDYQIAINLRRAVSSDELIEGQEFDPVLFVGLENTGQVSWEIADHYPEGNYFINIIAYKLLPITDEAISVENKQAFYLTHPQTDQNWLSYHNDKFNYRIDYPKHLRIREFPETKTGADFYRPEEESACITIAARDSINLEHLSFDDYVRVAAREEIQGFEKLNSIEPILTHSGISGYKTTWTYRVLAQAEQISLPITYFSALSLSSDENADMDYNYTIQVSLNDPECSDIYEQMILRFGQ